MNMYIIGLTVDISLNERNAKAQYKKIQINKFGIVPTFTRRTEAQRATKTLATILIYFFI